MITWFGWLGPRSLSWYSAKFGGYSFCGKAVIKLFICHVTILSKGNMAQWVGFFNHKLSLRQVWWPEVLWKSRYIFFELVTWPRNQKVTWLWKWGPPAARYYSAKADDHSYCGRADISFLNLSRDRVIKRSRDFDGGVPPWQVTILPSLVAIAIAEGKI